MIPVSYMKIVSIRDEVNVTGIKELIADNVRQFRSHVLASLFDSQKFINVDMSQVTALDMAGLESLLSLQAELKVRNGVLRLISPALYIEEILRLTMLRHDAQFEIVTD